MKYLGIATVRFTLFSIDYIMYVQVSANQPRLFPHVIFLLSTSGASTLFVEASVPKM